MYATVHELMWFVKVLIMFWQSFVCFREAAKKVNGCATKEKRTFVNVRKKVPMTTKLRGGGPGAKWNIKDVQGDHLYMAVLFWYLVKLSIVYATVYSIQGHVYLVGMYDDSSISIPSVNNQ